MFILTPIEDPSGKARYRFFLFTMRVSVELNLSDAPSSTLWFSIPKFVEIVALIHVDNNSKCPKTFIIEAEI